MEINSGERDKENEINFNSEKKRKEIIKNYKDLIPDIENYIYSKKTPTFDYKFLYREHKNKNTQQKYINLSRMIADIRNNTEPTSDLSNTIIKTDNKFSNETKKLVKHLLAKGMG